MSTTIEGSFSAYKLAGGVAGNGLPVYHRELEKIRDQQKVLCMTHRLVLGILALIATSLSYVLFNYTLTNYTFAQAFIGVAFGVGAACAAIWLTIQISRALIFRCQSTPKEVVERANTSLTFEQVLLEMEKPETTAEQLKHALYSLEPSQRLSFFVWTHQRYFTEDAPLVNVEQKKILQAFAQFPDELKELDLRKLHQEFARQILIAIDPNVVLLHDGEWRATGRILIQELFNRLGRLSGEESEKIFARHPSILAAVARQTKQEGIPAKIAPAYSPELLARIFGHMDDRQKIQFMKEMRRAITPHMDPAPLQVWSLIVWVFINVALEKKDDSIAVDKKLLKQLCKWPVPLSTALYLGKNLKLNDDIFLQAVGEALSEEDRKYFINYVVKRYEEKPLDFGKSIHDYLDTYAEKDQMLPTLTRLILTSSPRLMASVLPDLSEKATALVQSCLDRMTKQNQMIFFETLRANHPAVFQKQMTPLLVSCESKNGSKNPFLIDFLLRNPDCFTFLIFKNNMLGSDEEQGACALKLLEQMDEKATQVIEALDNNSLVGYPYFNFLVNLLIQDANTLENIPKGRARLMALFKASRIMQEHQVYNLSGAKWNKHPAGSDWDAFNKSAEGA